MANFFSGLPQTLAELSPDHMTVQDATTPPPVPLSFTGIRQRSWSEALPSLSQLPSLFPSQVFSNEIHVHLIFSWCLLLVEPEITQATKQYITLLYWLEEKIYICVCMLVCARVHTLYIYTYICVFTNRKKAGKVALSG